MNCTCRGLVDSQYTWCHTLTSCLRPDAVSNAHLYDLAHVNRHSFIKVSSALLKVDLGKDQHCLSCSLLFVQIEKLA